MHDTKKVLVLCTGNRCRSQMMEGYLRHFHHDSWEVRSAGTKPSEVHPLAVKVMGMDGVDIQGQTSKHVDAYVAGDFDVVLTVCDSAKETCPYIPGAKQMLHHSFPDPDAAVGDEDAVLAVFLEVRDAIREFAKDFANRMDQP